MAGHGEVHLDIDAMQFLQAVVDEQVELVEAIEETGMGALMAGVADIGREKIAEAQAGLDRMIEADDTWHTPETGGDR
jgi:hypothetical protein